MDQDTPHSPDKGSSAGKPQASGLGKFWQELRRRHVVRVAAVYAVVGWLVIQVANATFEDFGIPIWAYRFLTQMPASIPDDKLLPRKLKSKLDAAIASGDRNQIRPLMQEVRAWAETLGIELLARETKRGRRKGSVQLTMILRRRKVSDTKSVSIFLGSQKVLLLKLCAYCRWS